MALSKCRGGNGADYIESACLLDQSRAAATRSHASFLPKLIGIPRGSRQPGVPAEFLKNLLTSAIAVISASQLATAPTTGLDKELREGLCGGGQGTARSPDDAEGPSDCRDEWYTHDGRGLARHSQLRHDGYAKASLHQSDQAGHVVHFAYGLSLGRQFGHRLIDEDSVAARMGYADLIPG